MSTPQSPSCSQGCCCARWSFEKEPCVAKDNCFAAVDWNCNLVKDSSEVESVAAGWAGREDMNMSCD